MRTAIRQGVFETNSSSTHSLTLCTVQDYRRWKDGDVYLSIYNKKGLPKFCTEEQALEWINWNKYSWAPEEYENLDDHLAEYYDIYTREKFFDYICDNGFERIGVQSITEGDVEIVAFGYFGHD